jgi:hypothetical protein
MSKSGSQSIGPISKLVAYFCEGITNDSDVNVLLDWYLINDWDAQINNRSNLEVHPWLVKSGSTPGGFIRWGRSTTRQGNPPQRLVHKPHLHFACSINQVGWVQVLEPETRGQHILSNAKFSCQESNLDWVSAFSSCLSKLQSDSREL